MPAICRYRGYGWQYRELFYNPDTYVVDFTTLSVGMMATFWYRNDAALPLIYPPRIRRGSG